MRLRITTMAAFLVGVAATSVSAQDKVGEKLDRAELDRRIVKAVYDAASKGTEIFNKKNYEGCYWLYYGTVTTVLPMLDLDGRTKVAQSVRDKLEKARTQKPVEGAFTLRAALDEILNDIAPPPKVEPPKTGVSPESPRTLWEKLGGTTGVTKLVNTVFLRAIEDPKVNFFRGKKYDPKEIDKLRQGVVEFISSATGGPLKYNGPDMKKAHAGMKITDEEFTAFKNIIEDVLRKQEPPVPDDAVKEFVKLVESTRGDIVTVKSKN